MITKFSQIVYSQLNKLNELVLVLLSIFIYLFWKERDIWEIFFIILFGIFLIKKPYYILLAISLSISMILIDYFLRQKHITSINGQFRVKAIISSGVIIKDHGTNILLSTKGHFRFNDLIEVSGRVEPPTNFSNFDYVGYLETHHISNVVHYPNIKLIGTSGDYRSYAREYLTNGPKEYREVAPLLLLGQKTHETKDIYNLAVKLSIVHLFVISGFHISLFYLIVTKLLTLLKVEIKISSFIAITIIFIYLFLLNFPISASRAFLLTLMLFINKQYLKSRFTSLSILAAVMAIFSLYHPWIIKSLSFIFTFIATGVILFLNTLEIKSKWIKNTIIIVGVYLSTLFISININGYVSIFGIIFGIILTPVFSFMFIVSLILFPFKDMMNYVYWAFEQLLFSLDSINILIYLPSFTKDISKVIYLISFSCLIIIKIWNLYMEPKTT